MERGAAEKPLAHGGPPPVPELSRRQKRRELDARRSKCRIRIGGHLERWCRLKEQLGFALHSQLAQFLLDRYSSHGSTWSSEPERLQPAALQRLVVLSHSHGQECSFVPDIQLPTAGGAAPLVWECVAGHRFSWGGDSGDSGAGGDSGDMECGPTLGATRRRSLRRDAAGANKDGEEGMAASHQGDEEMGDGGDSGGTAPQVPPDPEPAPAAADSAVPGDDGAEPREEEEDEDFDLAYSDDLRDENYHPSLESNSEPQRRQNQPKTRKKPIKEEQPRLEPPLPGSNPLEEEIGRVSCDQDTAQIGPKRIRYSGKREKGHFQALKIFLCFILNFVGGEKKLKVGEEEKSCWGAGSDPYSRVFPTFRMIFSRFFSRQEGGKAGDPPLRLRRLRQNLLQPPVPERERPGKIQNFWSVGWGCPGAGIWELIGVFFLILIFIFPPCWQHHQKYQHVHQKTFTCSEPTCGKSFNFKKHLKEHEKLHSGELVSVGIKPPGGVTTPIHGFSHGFMEFHRDYTSLIALPLRIPPPPVGFTPPVPPSPPTHSQIPISGSFLPPKSLPKFIPRVLMVLPGWISPDSRFFFPPRPAGLHLRVLRALLPHQQQFDHPPTHPHRGEAAPV
ncbi:zinc finger protein 692 isoform X2 [Taeniopygia guttata]|uniref:zinc finger protein 692 isoform X2 n=1 Tax=Taeniopygia guttata TaxID=59729 RepID=UPI003BB8E9D7